MVEPGIWQARPAPNGRLGLHEELQRKVRPLQPSDDPFYFPPAGYQHAVPGTVLRSRGRTGVYGRLIPQPVTATPAAVRTTNMYVATPRGR